MRLVNLLRGSLKLQSVAVMFVLLTALIYWPASQAEDTEVLIVLSVGVLSTWFLGLYVIFGAIFGIWTKQYTITRPQILRYFFKHGEQINNDHRYKREEIVKWCDKNTCGFIYVMPTCDIEKVFIDGHFFFKKKKDRLFFKMVWG